MHQFGPQNSKQKFNKRTYISSSVHINQQKFIRGNCYDIRGSNVEKFNSATCASSKNYCRKVQRFGFVRKKYDFLSVFCMIHLPQVQPKTRQKLILFAACNALSTLLSILVDEQVQRKFISTSVPCMRYVLQAATTFPIFHVWSSSPDVMQNTSF